MPTVAPSGNGTHAAVPKNDGGTLINAGNVDSDGVITKVLGINTMADNFGRPYGSRVLTKIGTGANTTDRFGISGILPSVGVAYTANATEWVIRGVATTLAGVANSVLLSEGSDYNGAVKDNIHQTSGTRSIGTYVTTTFNMLARPNGTINPTLVKGSGAGNFSQYVRPSGAGNIPAVDEAATPTRTIPGELTYRFGGPVPFNADYKAKDSFES
jgi:hypothetical protein